MVEECSGAFPVGAGVQGSPRPRLPILHPPFHCAVGKTDAGREANDGGNSGYAPPCPQELAPSIQASRGETQPAPPPTLARSPVLGRAGPDAEEHPRPLSDRHQHRLQPQKQLAALETWAASIEGPAEEVGTAHRPVLLLSPAMLRVPP